MHKTRLLPVILGTALLACETAPTALDTRHDGQLSPAFAMAVQRDIDEFLNAQGTYCIPDGSSGCVLFVPPVENFVGWADPARAICALFDYAGLADDWLSGASSGSISLGTAFAGSVTETPLDDGRAAVHVRLHTKNALTWAVEGCADFATDPIIFGSRAPDVFAGADAALGDGLLHVSFINTAPGAPFPDLIQLLLFPEPGQELRLLSTYFTAAGTTPAGEASRLTAAQTGLLFASFKGATADAFPVENINLILLGSTD